MKSFSILSLVLVAFVAACTAEDESVSKVKACLQQGETKDKIKCVADVLGSDLNEAAKKAEQIFKEGTQDIKDFFHQQGEKIHNFIQGNAFLTSIHDKLSGLKDKAEGWFDKIKEKFQTRERRQIVNPFAFDFTDTAKACVEQNKDSKLDAIKCVAEALVVKGKVSALQLVLMAEGIKEKVSSFFNREKRQIVNPFAFDFTDTAKACVEQNKDSKLNAIKCVAEALVVKGKVSAVQLVLLGQEIVNKVSSFFNREKRQIVNPFAYDFTDSAKACVEANKDNKLDAIKCVAEALVLKGKVSAVQLVLLGQEIVDKVSSFFNRQKRQIVNPFAFDFTDTAKACVEQNKDSKLNAIKCVAEALVAKGKVSAVQLVLLGQEIVNKVGSFFNRQKRQADVAWYPSQAEVQFAKQVKICMDMNQDTSPARCIEKLANGKTGDIDPVRVQTIVNYEAVLNELREWFEFNKKGGSLKEFIEFKKQQNKAGSHHRNANNRLSIPFVGDVMVFKKIVTECMEVKNAFGTEKWTTKEIMDCANAVAGEEIAKKYESIVDYIVKHTDAQTIQYIKDQAAKVHDFLNNAAPGFVQSIHEKGHQWYESVAAWVSSTWSNIFG